MCVSILYFNKKFSGIVLANNGFVNSTCLTISLFPLSLQGNTIIGAFMLTFYRTTPSVVLWQVANQSFNAVRDATFCGV